MLKENQSNVEKMKKAVNKLKFVKAIKMSRN